MRMLSEIFRLSKVDMVSYDNEFIKLNAEMPIELAEKLRRRINNGFFRAFT